jgi:uncharacterized membrane protein
MSVILAVLLRWLHVVSACLALGGVFFMGVVLPAGLRAVEGEAARAALLRVRRVFKMVIHTCILLLLVTGSYNAWANWGWYKLNPPLLHSMFGVHVLLAVGAIVVLLVVMTGAELPKSYRGLMTGGLVLMLLAVAAASTLKWGRDRAVAGRGSGGVAVVKE